MLTDSPQQTLEPTIWGNFYNFLLSSQTSKQNNQQDRNLQSAGNCFFGWGSSAFPQAPLQTEVSVSLGENGCFLSALIIFFSRTSCSYSGSFTSNANLCLDIKTTLSWLIHKHPLPSPQEKRDVKVILT